MMTRTICVLILTLWCHQIYYTTADQRQSPGVLSTNVRSRSIRNDRRNLTSAIYNSSFLQDGLSSQHRIRKRATVESADVFYWDRYNRFSTILRYLRSLPEKHPKLVKYREIGKSVENRPLVVLVIGNQNPTNRVVWIDGGIHAREWISPATVLFIVRTLVANWTGMPDYVKNISWYILPMLNPDGYEYSHTHDRLWRKNRRKVGKYCNGVDLNRNFGYKWGYSGSSSDSCDEIYRGTGPFSEPESYYMSQYLSKIKPKPAAYLSYHSFGQYILYPFGYARKPVADTSQLRAVGLSAASRIRRLTSTTYTVAPSYILGSASGASDDWAKAVLGIKYTYTIELRDKGYYAFRLPAKQIRSTAKEGWTVAKTIAQAVDLLK